MRLTQVLRTGLRPMRPWLTYLQEAGAWQRRYPGTVAWGDLARYFGRWKLAISSGTNPLEDGRPWMTFTAIEALERIVTRDSRVFEWGMGGSSVFFATRAAEVVSVEHDSDWYAVTCAAMRDRGLDNWSGILVPAVRQEPAPTMPVSADPYRSSDPALAALSFRDYAHAIDPYPPATFDIVVVDGRARLGCVQHALDRVRPGGLLIVDNADRESYLPAFQLLASHGWTLQAFNGPGPYIPGFWNTYFWKRPDRTGSGN